MSNTVGAATPEPRKDASRWMRPTILIVGAAVILFMTYFGGVRRANKMLRAKDDSRAVYRSIRALAGRT